MNFTVKRASCATCRHWVPLDQLRECDFVADEEDVERATKFARSFIVTRRLGLCRKAQGVDPIDPTTLAIAEDGSDYIANFRTAAEFGCVMHEEKT